MSTDRTMELSNQQLQKKPSRTGFFILLGMIAIIIIAAYLLTISQKNFFNIESASEKQNRLVREHMAEPATVQLTEQQKAAVIKRISTTPTKKQPVKKLTPEQQAAVNARLQQ